MEISEYSKKIIAMILTILSLILYIFSVYNTKISTIPYYLDLGLIEVLPVTFPLAIILLVVVMLYRIEKMGEFNYIILLVLLSCFIWGVRVFVESYAHAHDAWNMGYITKEVIEAGRFSVADQNKPAMYYIGWPGSFVLLATLVDITGLQTIDILKVYPLIISPILFLSVYTLFKILSKNQLLSRYAALFFLIVNNFVYIHWSPQSISLVLFITLVLLMKQFENAHSFLTSTLIVLTIFSIIIIHPTMSVLLIIFLICMYIIILLSNNIKNAYIDTHLSLNFLTTLLLISTLLFVYWNLFVSTYTFSGVIKDTIPILTNFIKSESTTSFAVSRVTSPTIATQIRSSFFFISSFITIGYLAYIFLKRKEIKIYETVFLMLAFAFAFIAFNLSKGAYSERVPMVAYLSTSLVFGLIYVKLNNKKRILKYTFISFLLITFTFYDHDILDLYSDGIINGYNFSFSNSNSKPTAISKDTYTMGIPFLILNDTLFLENVVFKNVNTSVPIQDYYIVSDSNVVKWSFNSEKNMDNYTTFINNIDNDFARVYENPAITVYLNPKYEYKEGS